MLKRLLIAFVQNERLYNCMSGRDRYKVHVQSSSCFTSLFLKFKCQALYEGDTPKENLNKYFKALLLMHPSLSCFPPGINTQNVRNYLGKIESKLERFNNDLVLPSNIHNADGCQPGLALFSCRCKKKYRNLTACIEWAEFS